VKVLVVEDGYEYFDTFRRFLTEGFEWVRAGAAREALQLIQERSFDAVLLDMCFDRIPPADLLGDVAEAAERFNGDKHKGLRFLQEHQGNYILADLRASGCALPVVISYDFDDEPRRWAHLIARFAPLDYLPDNFGPRLVEEKLRSLLRR
jgi:DNA-binding response OmpR family regulator